MDREAYRHWYNNVYLRSAHWARIRTQALLRAGNRCQRCGKFGPAEPEHAVYFRDVDLLQVHHINYARIGHEAPKDLLVLCRKCHCRVHGLPIPASAYLTWEEKILKGLEPGFDVWFAEDREAEFINSWSRR